MAESRDVRSIVAGIDGGGSRTRAALATSAGELLGVGEAGSGNYHDVGPDGFADHLGLAVSRAWETARLSPRRLDAIFLGLGSIVTPQDRDAIGAIVAAAPWAPTVHIGVDHDLRIAHQGCLGGAPGLVLIAGTGSAAYGRDAQGLSWKTGGWGPLLDDVGSGHWLGRQAMIAAIRESDGRGPATTLSPAVLEALKVTVPLEILRRVEFQGMTRTEIAALARLVIAAAAGGDDVAREIIDTGVAALAELVEVTAEQLELPKKLPRIPVAATGGLLESGEVFTAPLRHALARRVPQAELVDAQAPPVVGAVMLAIELRTGRPLPGEAARRLSEMQRNVAEISLDCA